MGSLVLYAFTAVENEITALSSDINALVVANGESERMGVGTTVGAGVGVGATVTCGLVIILPTARMTISPTVTTASAMSHTGIFRGGFGITTGGAAGGPAAG